MRKRKAVALAGLSDVGKSTFLKNVRRELVFEHLQASDLIKTERQVESVAHDLLREGNIDGKRPA